MNVDYVRQVASECDELLGQLTTEKEATPELRLSAVACLARAAAVLNTAVLPPESHGEHLNGSGSVSVTGEVSTGPQGTDEPIRQATSYELLTELQKTAAERDELEAELRDTNEHLERITIGDYRKCWHEAATQRDALARAARNLLAQDNDTNRSTLHRLVADALSAAPRPTHTDTSDRLRRELWHVLDRMPASDDDLIAAVRNLKTDRNPAVTEGQLATLLCHTIRKTIDECPEPPGAEGLCRVLGRAVSEHLRSRAVDSSSP